MLSCLRRSKRLAPQARAPVGGTNTFGLSFVEDSCVNVHCENGGFCKDGACMCPDGFVGCRCEVDNCKNMQGFCLHGGTCSRGKCQCPDGFTGAVCQTRTDSCTNINCKNGGSCNSGKCICPEGFFGSRCQYDHCNSLICLNGATCAAGKCQCPKGFSGAVCQNSPDLCKDKKCLNGASCKDGVCQCPDGWIGERCENGIDHGFHRQNSHYFAEYRKTAIECQKECAKDPKCKVWSFFDGEARNWLNGDPKTCKLADIENPAVQHSYYISGKK